MAMSTTAKRPTTPPGQREAPEAASREEVRAPTHVKQPDEHEPPADDQRDAEAEAEYAGESVPHDRPSSCRQRGS